MLIDLGYRARAQFVPFHKRRERWACLVAHRRAGKTVACIMDLISRALLCDKPNPRFAYLAPTYAQAKDVAWGYLKQFTAELPQVQQRESDLAVILHNGARIRLYGVENYDRLRGLYLDGCILDEAGDVDPRAWPEVIRPALSDREGWGVFIGTPKGRNDFHEIWKRAESSPDWFALMLKASETGLLREAELTDIRLMLTPEQYEQEMECSFDAAIRGAYYGQEIAQAEAEGRISKVDIDPHAPVHTAWDIGTDDATAIWWWQSLGSKIHVVDHYEAHGKGISHYAAVVVSKGYRRGDDWVPHDARQREWGADARQRIEAMIAAGLKPRLVPSHEVADGINAARVTFRRVWFDAYRCKYGLDCLRAYQTEYDDKRKVYGTRPLHNWASHTADAFRYLAMAWRERTETAAQSPHREPTLDDLWDSRAPQRRRI